MKEQILVVINSVVQDRVITIDRVVSESLDSITFIKIIIALEKEFGFEFDDDMLILSDFSTVGSLIDYVITKVESLNV